MTYEDIHREQWQPGEVAFFEYHCYEGHDSADAQAWYHSHQQVTVLEECYLGTPDSPRTAGIVTASERSDAAWPVCYEVRFADGLTWTAFEDELLTRPYYERPDPPNVP